MDFMDILWDTLKITVAVIIILLLCCCGLGTAIPAEIQERQIRFGFITGKTQHAKKDTRVLSQIRIVDNLNQLVIPLGKLEVVILGPDGPFKPVSAVHNATNILDVTFEAPTDGDYKLIAYYDGVIVNDLRTYPFDGLAGREKPTPLLTNEIDDHPHRIPVPTEETAKPREIIPEPEPVPEPIPEPVHVPEPEPVPEPIPEPEVEEPFSEDDKTEDSSEEERPQENSTQTPKKVKKGFMGGIFHSDKKAGQVAPQTGLQVHVEYPQRVLPVDKDTLITVRLEDLGEKKYVDEPGADIYCEIEGPKKKKLQIKAEKVEEIGTWKVRFHPTETGKYKAKVFFNKQDAQKKWSTLHVGSAIGSVTDILPLPNVGLGKKKEK
eukprot:TRINITY_DN15330_c0_g1_i1.p1 TRINITY_DN15330_c0_g1~~TRINITY_DN15330_c0_g1_i1.p1  ORF type:complete len:385 (-),score=102.26 TRINITY_DN15330_c0_g1_i1:30-1163(-)